MARRKRAFLICIRNDDCEDLELRKVYEVLPDNDGAKHGYVRVADESGEDYLYPAKNFVAIELPRGAERALAGTSR